MKFSNNDFFSKCDQTRRAMRICSHLLKKYLMENFIFCTVQFAVNIFLIPVEKAVGGRQIAVRSLSYKNQSVDLQSKSMEWFLFDRGLCHERIKFQS